MPDLATLLLIALLPAAGTLAGALVAEWRQPPPWLTGAALHAAAGIAAAVVAVELMPRAVGRGEQWLLAIGFMGGAVASILLMRTTGWIRGRLGSGEGRAGLWGVYAAVATDLLIDGLTTGAGSAVSGSLGLLLALSQVAANIPGGFAVTANFRAADVPRSRRLIAACAYPLTPVAGAAAGYLVLRGSGDVTMALALSFFAGLLLLATIEQIVPEADKPGAPLRISSPAFAAGFILLMLMSAYLDV
ncbi:peptidoglycan-binding protein [Phenylobacterium sp.]|uniref:peptidoglycan-binding protein n=1 Tax=Phenylobacterium sp. TaxID=1871053 RepID=UPI0035C7C5F6